MVSFESWPHSLNSLLRNLKTETSDQGSEYSARVLILLIKTQLTPGVPFKITIKDFGCCCGDSSGVRFSDDAEDLLMTRSPEFYSQLKIFFSS